MDKLKVKEYIYNFIQDNHHCRVVDNDSLNLKCFICGDSKKDPNKKRLFIKFNKDIPSAPIVYNCFNCNSSGVWTQSMSREIGITSMSVNSALRNLNSSSKEYIRRVKEIKKISLMLKNTLPEINSDILQKVKYLNNRLGLDFTPQEWVDHKVVLSLRHFLIENELDLTVKPYIADILEKGYVGFLTVYNENIIFRNIYKNNRPRYFKYTIIKSIFNSHNFYVIPGKINLMDGSINIRLCEGTFDSLGILYNIHDGDRDNNVYAAVGTATYRSALEYFIKMGFIGSRIHVYLYLDKDQPVSKYQRIIDNYKIWFGKIHVIYNELYKDYGVPKKYIKINEVV